MVYNYFILSLSTSLRPKLILKTGSIVFTPQKFSSKSRTYIARCCPRVLILDPEINKDKIGALRHSDIPISLKKKY